MVGVLRVGSLTIEILPKAEAERDSGTIDRSQLVERWKSRLLRMLKESHHLDIRSVDEASLRLQNHTILDLSLNNSCHALHYRSSDKAYIACKPGRSASQAE